MSSDTLGHIGRRAHSRLRVRLPARLHSPHDARDCELTNLSEAGAQIVIQDPPKLFADFVLKSIGLEAFCSIIWIKGNRCGLKFDEPLPKALVLDIRALEATDLSGKAHAAAARGWAEGTAKFNSSD